MDWTFVYLMFFLKIPIIGLLWIVWWAIHNVDEEAATDDPEGDDDGGGGLGRAEHPRGPKPRPARRGPHPGPPALPPARSRTPVPAKRRVGREG